MTFDTAETKPMLSAVLIINYKKINKMKYIFFAIAFIFWCVTTVLSIPLIIPMLILLETNWFDFPEKLLDKC